MARLFKSVTISGDSLPKRFHRYQGPEEKRLCFGIFGFVGIGRCQIIEADGDGAIIRA